MRALLLTNLVLNLFFKSANENKKNVYVNELLRLDLYLKKLFDYISLKYSDEDILISLYSDHGQSYLGKNNYLLGEHRLNVPWLLRGCSESGSFAKYTEAVDIYPTMAYLSGIPIDGNIDGQIPSIFDKKNIDRKFAYSESIYPGQTMKAIFRLGNYSICCESEAILGENKKLKSSVINGYLLDADGLKVYDSQLVNEKINILVRRWKDFF